MSVTLKLLQPGDESYLTTLALEDADFDLDGLSEELEPLSPDVARRFLERGISSMLLFGDARSPSNGFYEAMGGERITGATPEDFHGAYGWPDLNSLVTRCG